MVMPSTFLLFGLILLGFKLDLSESNTNRIRLLACDSANRRLIAGHITTGNVRGKLECYFEPQSVQHSFRILVRKLNLAARGTDCPYVKFIGFTTKMLMPESDDVWRRSDRRISIPADPQLLQEFNCNNYQTAAGKIIEAVKLGQKLVVEYDTKNIQTDRVGDVNFILTSYKPGPSYNCPQNTFRCWSTRHVCIDSSLECDTVDNCYDNSDEENFRCTGKILGILLPLFIIIVLLISILLIAFVIGVFLYCRRRRRRRQKLVEERKAAMNYHGMTSPYYISNSQTLYHGPDSSSRTQLAPTSKA